MRDPLREFAIDRRRVALLAAILLVALGIRLLYSAHIDNTAFLEVDGRDYQDIAKSIASGRGFAATHYRWFEPVPPQAPEVHADLYRPPLLPLLGAALYALPGDWLHWARITMLTLGLLLVPLAGLLGAILLGPAAGLVAAGILAIDPFAVHYSTTWSTETPFALLLLAGITALARSRGSGRPIVFITAGLFLGLACLARPTGLLIAMGVIAWLLASRQSVGRLRAGILVLLAMMIPLAPWAARNAAVTGTPNPGTYFGPYNMWLGNNHRMHQMYAAGESSAFPPLLRALYDEDSKSHVRKLEQRGACDVASANRYWLRECASYAANSPGEEAGILAHRFLHFWRPWPNRATTASPIFWASLLGFGVPMIFAAFSLLTRPTTRDPLLTMPILLGLAACMPFIFHLRFRFPVLDPYLAVLAAPSLLAIPKALKCAAALVRRPSKQ